MKRRSRTAGMSGPITTSASPYCGAMSRWLTPAAIACSKPAAATSGVEAQKAAPPRTAIELSWPVRPRRRRSMAPSCPSGVCHADGMAEQVKVAVLADTHMRPGRRTAIPPRVVAALGRCDVILHAGDVLTAEVLEELAAYAPVHAVLGNNDHD